MHFAEIIGDEKKSRGIEAGGNRLANIDIAGNYDPINGGVNRAAG